MLRGAGRNGRGTTLLTLSRGLAVLEMVATNPRPSVKEVAGQLELNTTTVYHLVNTLEAHHYLVRDSDKRLQIGPAAALLHRAFLRETDGMPDARAVVRRMSRETGQTAYLAQWRRGSLVLQTVIEGVRPVRVSGLVAGTRGDEHARASGKAVLAYLPGAEVEKFLAKRRLHARTDRTITDVEEFQQELADIRRRGYAIDREEFVEGVCCVAAPFLDVSALPRGAVSISAPRDNFEESVHELTQVCLAAAGEVSRQLGYRGLYPLVDLDAPIVERADLQP